MSSRLMMIASWHRVGAGVCLCLLMQSVVAFFAYGKNKEEKKPAEALQEKSLVLYTSRNEELIKPVVDLYSKKSGVKVTYHSADAGMLLTKIKSQKNRQEADLFMTVDAGNLWAAKQAGILQPVSQRDLMKKVPAPYRDSEGYWFGVSLRARTLFYNPEKMSAKELSTYEALAEPRFKGKLCLRTSKKVYNQSLVAMLISEHGHEKTSEVVKGWVGNLAAPVFSSDTKLIEAVASGQCAVAIANSYYYGRLLKKNPKFSAKIFWPNQSGKQPTGVHVNVSGVGVLKHTKKPELAEDFVAFLLTEEAQALFAGLNLEYPVRDAVKADPVVVEWGPFAKSSMPLSVAGEKQQEAIKLMDKAGYL